MRGEDAGERYREGALGSDNGLFGAYLRLTLRVRWVYVTLKTCLRSHPGPDFEKKKNRNNRPN